VLIRLRLGRGDWVDKLVNGFDAVC
jgi:hypothetical protein